MPQAEKSGEKHPSTMPTWDREQVRRVTRGRAARWLAGACGALVCLWGAFEISAEEAQLRKVVLMVFRKPGHTPTDAIIEQAARDKFRDLGGDGIEIYTEHLYPDGFRDYLREKYRDRRPDVILTTSMVFSELASGNLIPGVPEVFMWVSPDPFPTQSPGTNITGVVAVVDFRGTLDLIFRLQPDTRRIVVIGGVAPSDRRRLAQVEQTSQSFSNRAVFEFWTNQPMSELQTAVSRLSTGTVVLYAWMFKDVSGRPFVPTQALELLLAKASVPVYVFADLLLGSGAVGGAVVPYDELGARAGEVAHRILQGTNADDIPITAVTNATPKFDRLALRRWGISESRLPPGSIVEYRQRTFWEEYRWHVVGILAFCGLQTALIIGLLVNRAKRRQGEMEAALIADISSKFVNLPATAVDREIEDVLRRVCESLNIDLAVLWQWSEVSPGAAIPTHAYCTRKELRPSGPMSQDQYPWAVQQVLAGRTFAISSLADYPAEAAVDRQTCQQFGIKAGVCIPLSVGGEAPIGALGLNALRAERDWPDALVQRLQLVAQVFANALARKRADQALRESEELNRATFEQAAVGIAHVATDGRWLRVNDKLCAIVGYSRDELLQSTFQEITHPDDLPRDQVLLRQFLSGEIKTGSLEKRYLRKDQSTIWVVISVSLARTASGDPLHFITVVEDITERKQAEGRVSQLSHAVEQSPVLVVITDLRGRITYVNRKFTEVTGYSQAECIGQNPRILKSGESPPSVYKEMWNCITHGRTWRGEFHNRKKNGELYWERAVISPLLDAAGKATHFVGVKEDITERKHAEAELLQQRTELAHVARVSTIGELAASVAHELNQPLGAILANAEAAELFLEQEPPALDDLSAILADIRKDDERAGEVIRRLRALLRKRELERQPLEINSLVEDVFALVSGDAVLRGVSLSADLGPVLPQVAGDRVHLQQVLLNLILNGMDALAGQPRERRRIQVRTRLRADGLAEMAVIDSGHGIEPIKLPRVFEAFYTTKPNGMGMGLSIARRVIEAHQGRIWAENNPSGGATFYISLPAIGQAPGVRDEGRGTREGAFR
jgi:PAS domain S-box-containing protein